MRAILASLISGEHGKFPHLEETARNKLIKLLPREEQEMIATLKSKATADDSSKEIMGLQSWMEKLKVTNENNEQQDKATSLLCSIPIRSTSCIQQSAQAKKPTPAASKKLIRKEKLSTTEYFQAWDKFSEDTDSDGETPLPKITKPRLVEDTAEIARRNRDAELCELQRQIANFEFKQSEREFSSEREREKGNEHFKSREDEDAHHCYTKSILLDPSNAKSLANRAAVSLRFGKDEEAIADCTKAINIDPTYTKAIARRGMTLHRLERYGEAAADFKMCHSLDPGSGYSRMMIKSEEKQNQTMTRLTIEECDSEVEGDETIEEVFTPGILADSEQEMMQSQSCTNESWQKISIVEVSESDEESQDNKESSLLRRVEITCEDEIVEEGNLLKEKGNEAKKAGQFDMAINQKLPQVCEAKPDNKTDKRRFHDSSALCF